MLCGVIADPSAYVDQKITLTGIANMHQHGSNIGSKLCPERTLALYMEERPWKQGVLLSPAGEFFAQLATRPDSPVSVNGRIIVDPNRPSAYTFQVESGRFDGPGG